MGTPRLRAHRGADKRGPFHGGIGHTEHAGAPRQGSEGWPRVPRLCEGGTVVCIGGGPSLTPADVDHCRGRASAVVAINDAYRLAPWADVLYAADSQWWGWHKGVPAFGGLKYSLQKDAARWPNVQILRNTGEQGLELDPSGLRTGRNGGYQAINLAAHLTGPGGRILLLAYDMHVHSGRSHWFGDHPHARSSPFATFLERFRGIVEPLRLLNITVINCSRATELHLFPKQPITEALP